MRRTALIAMLILTVPVLPSLAREEDEDKDKDKSLTATDKAAIARAVGSGIVRVEYALRFDKGQEPRGGKWGGYERHVREERPLEGAGMLLSSDKVLTEDLMIQPRFIKSVAVRFGPHAVKAEPAGYAVDQNAMFLKLERPLKGAKPLKFDPGKEGPYVGVSRDLVNGEWATTVSSVPTDVTVGESGRRFIRARGAWLIVDEAGTPVGACTTGLLDTGDAWKGSPLKWPVVSAADMDKRIKALKARADGALFRVALSFRSPKKSAGGMSSYSYRSSDEDKGTEKNVTGILIDAKTVVVLANLKPKVTARLERITVHRPAGGAFEAKFAHTLTDYGCFLARLGKSLKGGVKLSTRPVRSLHNRLLLSAEIILQGQKRVTHFWHRRIDGYDLGWKRHVYPQVGGEDENVFLFDDDGALAVFPLARRPKVSTEERWSRRGEVLSTPAARLKEVMSDLAANTDPNNVPLIAEKENRLAWLGVLLQPLNKELARSNNVSHLTRDGKTGALVSYVFTGSPADKAGVKASPDVTWVLLNLRVEGHPKPVNVRAQDHRIGAKYPWDRWDTLPPRYWDGKFPTPWQPVENIFTRTLTDLGFGKKFTATFFSDGKLIKKSFTVTPGPRHFDTAARFKSKAVGVTVREMTYEVRRYFQKKPDDPGVIVSAVEPGSKAGVGGVRPYEIITHVNDRPVKGVKDFEKLIKDQAELRLAVLRVTKGRLVKLAMGAK